MRIIAGRYKGRRLADVPGYGTRPTTDRVKEAWASSCHSLLPDGFSGAAVLDAFAGSGALGLEALSRGATFCCFIESSRAALAALRQNLAFAEAGTWQLVRADAFRPGLAAMLKAPAPFNLVALDPPYDKPAAEVRAMLSALADAQALADGALVSYEHRRSDDRSLAPLDPQAAESHKYHKIAAHTYGDTMIEYYEVQLKN